MTSRNPKPQGTSYSLKDAKRPEVALEADSHARPLSDGRSVGALEPDGGLHVLLAPRIVDEELPAMSNEYFTKFIGIFLTTDYSARNR